MNSKWHANKIGLLNFWYYDEQEFYFVKGRMLLRGSNGSGKSVTMQSVVPLLLDGNMSPERLDPFRSKDRKMNSYLLEENDGREERTGYLYIEFKREESDTYISFGMGLRARRGKPMEKWYFALTDNRRIGKDFLLYKEIGEKVPLSKKELQNRLMSGGRVFERQQDYMEYVNKKIFGFDTVEEYKEMIDLLIQLRTPKLSKDFRPTVINDILCDSLQPLSDDELRPMSEAIENMDTMNMNMKARKEAKSAAEKINRVFDKYNHLVLLERAEALDKTETELRGDIKEQREKEKQITQAEKRIQELKTEKENLDTKNRVMQEERESLNNSNAVSLKQKEIQVREEIQSVNNSQRMKQQTLDRKQDQYIDEKNHLKEEEDQIYGKKNEVDELLEEMQEYADDMEFSEHTFFQEEMQKDLDEFAGFSYHDDQFKKVREKISQCLGVLKDMEHDQIRREERQQEREKLLREKDILEKKAAQTENQLIQVQNEWIENLHIWNKKNRFIKPGQEVLKEFEDFIEHYEIHSDYTIVKEKIFDLASLIRRGMDEQLAGIHTKVKQLKEAYDEQEKLLKEWENRKEPVPPRSEEVIRNRERLKKEKIPYLEFYKAIEFGQELTEEERDRLEEALLSMGILDALIIDEEYKDRVLTMEKGCSDRYLFQQKKRVESSLLDVLEINDVVNNVFFNQKISSLLASIEYGGEGTVSILKNGTYQSGILTGTVSGCYQAGYLGTQARENNRQKQITLCMENMGKIREELGICESQIEKIEKDVADLIQERDEFPKIADVYEAQKMFDEAQRLVDNMTTDIRRIEKIIQEVSEKIKEKNAKALEIAEGLYLKCSLSVFERADDAARLYEQKYHQLKALCEIYQSMVKNIEQRKARIEDMELDIDELRYDLSQCERELSDKKQEAESIAAQLELSGYQQIRERLDACTQWVKDYPKQLERIVEESSKKAAQIENARVQLQSLKKKIEQLSGKEKVEEEAYRQERALEYVEFEQTEEKSLKDLIVYLKNKTGNLQKESVVINLNKVFQENKAFLNDYQPLITETDASSGNTEKIYKRMHIMVRYRGVKIPFGKLLCRLEKDIEELQGLIVDGDRALFEDILGNTVSRKIRARINTSNAWVEKMNQLMGAMNTSSGLKLSLRWRSRHAEEDDQLDTKELVELLKKDYRLMREEEAEKLSKHFRSKVERARRNARDSGGSLSFYQVMKETLDYRKWFEFQLFYQKPGEKQKELTNSVFGTFSGGEKAMSMYVPLFSAVVAKYQGGSKDAPRLISLDEAFAGVDNHNIRDMFRLMSEFQFDFIINSQVLWGDCDTLDALAIYQLIRPENAKFITVMSYLWNGYNREMMEDEGMLEAAATKL